MRRIRRLLRLTGGEARLLLRAFVHLAAARAMVARGRPHDLRGVSFGRAMFFKADFTATQAAWAVDALARALPGTHCLVRALALRMLLHSGGFRPRMRIGVAGGGPGGFRAHAWV